MKKLLNLFRMAAGQTVWHRSTQGDHFVWRRWVAGQWCYREMTDAEQTDAYADWAIK